METSRLRPLLFVFVIVAGCGDVNVETDSFATMDEARQRGAVDRGWVPAFLPERAYELRAAYDTDTQRRWGILNFRTEDAGALRGALQPDEVPLDGVTIDIPPRIEWWPIALRNELNHETIAATGLRAYRNTTGEYLFAVNWNQGRAYYWRVPESARIP